MTDKFAELNKSISGIESWLSVDRLPWLIAGPCSAESRQQVMTIARQVAQCPNVKVFRAGLWKPRTRPGCFEGVGKSGLKWLRAVKQETSLLTATEVASARHVEACLKSEIDVLWVGARTTVNPFLVQEIADALKGVDVPVLVKNPINAELGLWIGAIERLSQAGVTKITAIHRGFSTYIETEYRNRPNWQIPIELKRTLPALPLICDPSHIAGNRNLIEPVSQMAMDFGINALMIEVHNDPEHALSDSQQQVTPEQLTALLEKLKVRDSDINDQRMHARVARLRAAIDQVDSRIMQDLAERMKWVEEIGRLKRLYNVPVLQLNRWEYLLDDHVACAKAVGLDDEFIKAIFELIHTQSIRKQITAIP